MFSARGIASLGVSAALATGCGGGSSKAAPSPANGGVAAGGGPSAGPDAQGGVKGTVTRDLDAGSSDPNVAYAVTLTMTSFSVAAGAEVFKCQDFANPFGGGQVDIKAWKVAMSAGSHHMTLFNAPGTSDGPLIDCPGGGLMEGIYSFGSQIPNATYPYPDGVGETVVAGMGFTVNAHYINIGAMPIEGAVAVTGLVEAPGHVTQHAGAMQFVLLSIDVPPSSQPVTVGSSCTLPQDMNVFAISAHMHSRATHFDATSGGKMLYAADQLADLPPGAFSPPLQLKAGADLSWSCGYTNETSQDLSYGASALSNVMCNTVLAFYPLQDLNSPLLTCIK
jgi:hypothetical protein